MANKSLGEYSALTPNNIRTSPTITVGDAAFELKPALINMVQASQFCGKAHEDANSSKISWRYVAPSRSKMFKVMQSYFIYSHCHYWGERSNGFTPTKTNLQLGHCVLLPIWQSSFI
jgi:hypothetical protein